MKKDTRIWAGIIVLVIVALSLAYYNSNPKETKTQDQENNQETEQPQEQQQNQPIHVQDEEEIPEIIDDTQTGIVDVPAEQKIAELTEQEQPTEEIKEEIQQEEPAQSSTNEIIFYGVTGFVPDTLTIKVNDTITVVNQNLKTKEGMVITFYKQHPHKAFNSKTVRHGSSQTIVMKDKGDWIFFAVGYGKNGYVKVE